MATYERNKGYVVAALASSEIRDTYHVWGLLEAEAIGRPLAASGTARKRL